MQQKKFYRSILMNISVDRKKSVCFSNNFISKRCQKYTEKYYESEKEKVDKFQFARERYGEWMRILHEFSWLWETLVIALATAAVCVVCAMLICRIVKRDISKKIAAVIGVAAFAGAVLAVIMIAQTPMPLWLNGIDDFPTALWQLISKERW